MTEIPTTSARVASAIAVIAMILVILLKIDRWKFAAIVTLADTMDEGADKAAELASK